MSIEDKIKEQIKDNKILIYMKGSPYENLSVVFQLKRFNH